MLDRASETRGLLIVSAEEGAQQGFVSDVFIDTDTKCVSAFATRRRRFAGRDYYVPVADVQLVGRDVLLVANEHAMRRITGADRAPGRSLKDLLGVWVTTMDGVHLGTLVDVEFASSDWGLLELILADDRRLPVEREEIRIGDEILVPVGYGERLEPDPTHRTGLLSRAFGREAIDDTREVIRRAQRKARAGEKAEA